jgi:hypothetical protein
MVEINPGIFEPWGTLVDALGTWLSTYALLVIIVLSVLLAILIYVPNRNNDSAQTYGRIAKVIMSATGALTALTLLLPFVARALWGTASSSQPTPPPCFAEIAPACGENLSQYLAVLSRTTVPVSTLLGVSVLSLFLAAFVWFLTAIRDAFK